MTHPEPPGHSAPRLILLLVLLVGIALLTLAEARMPYLPGDPTLARGIQTLGPISNALAQWITKTAETPWCIILLGLAVLCAWAISGWRAALLAFPVFFGLWLFGIWLSPLIAQPRPLSRSHGRGWSSEGFCISLYLRSDLCLDFRLYCAPRAG